MSNDETELRSHPKFERDYEKMTAQGKGDQINKGLNKIRKRPKRHSKHLKGEYKGLRSHQTGQCRIIFAYCPECIERGDTEHNNCADCEDLHGENQEEPMDIIKLFETGDRSSIYD